MEECAHEFHWYPTINEKGWKCCLCGYQPGEPAGFSPHLDWLETQRKVGAILLDLDHHGFVSVSNGSEGESICRHVARVARERNHLTQLEIIGLLVAALDDRHGLYWRGVRDGIIAGSDPRPRCACGVLATRFSWRNGNPHNTCSGCEDYLEAF